jgi:hypothetical protein
MIFEREAGHYPIAERGIFWSFYRCAFERKEDSQPIPKQSIQDSLLQGGATVNHKTIGGSL